MTPDLRAALGELPVFPLPRLAFFPHTVLPLHVFEPRYRALLSHCLKTHGAMAVVMLDEEAAGAAGDQPRIAGVAGAGLIARHEVLPDGRSNILLAGQVRVRLDELPFVAPFRRARATVLDTVAGAVTELDRAALIAAARSFVRTVRAREPRFSFDVPESLDAGAVADVCAAHLLADPRARQAMLEQLDDGDRVAFVTRELTVQEHAMGGERRVLN